MECRVGCGACCVVPAINEPYEGHPGGKLAGQRCNNLTDDNRCGIYDRRPDVCRAFEARVEACGGNDAKAFYLLQRHIDSKRRSIPLTLTVAS